MLDKRQLQFNLSHLIILRHLWEKATFVSVSQGTSSYCKAIKGCFGLGEKNPKTSLTSYFPFRLQRCRYKRCGSRPLCRRSRAFPKKTWRGLKESFALTAAKMKTF